MTRQHILELIELLPDDIPYLGDEAVAGKGNLSLCYRGLELTHACLYDPAFGFHFIRSFVEAGRQLPSSVCDKALLLAYWWHTAGGPEDPGVSEALRIGLPWNTRMQDVLQALLLIPDLKSEVICRLVTITPEALRLYIDLFFNVIDRRNEPDYIRQLVYPETRRVTIKEDYLDSESNAFLLRRVAYEKGLEAVKRLAGFRSESRTGAIDQAGQKFEAEIMDKANFVVSLNGGNCSAKVLQHARSLVTSRKGSSVIPERGEDEFGLSKMSVDCAILEHLKRSQLPDELLIRQRQYDEAEAKAGKGAQQVAST